MLVTEITAPPAHHRTRLLNLRAKQCRFILSDDLRDAVCCGAPTQEGSSWCAWHRKLVYIPSRLERYRQLTDGSEAASSTRRKS
ncbi:GcrA family cell cycle regulator [Microvirga aerophila]|uniref:GcrA family cell cycle regulator n=1 Tax=Microvirga aerophila TaxID=670291 RepID=UPI0011BF0E66